MSEYLLSDTREAELTRLGQPSLGTETRHRVWDFLEAASGEQHALISCDGRSVFGPSLTAGRRIQGRQGRRTANGNDIPRVQGRGFAGFFWWRLICG